MKTIYLLNTRRDNVQDFVDIGMENNSKGLSQSSPNKSEGKGPTSPSLMAKSFI